MSVQGCPSLHRAFQCRSLPVRPFGGSLVGLLQETEQERIRIGGLANDVIGQNELAERVVIIGAGRAQRGLCVVYWLRVGVSIVRGPSEAAVAWPESATAHLMRIGLGHHPTPDIWSASSGRRSKASGKASHRQIETAPEKMHWADLAKEARAKILHDPRALHQHLPEAGDVDAIVLGVDTILFEARRVLDLDRHRPDVHRNAESAQPVHELLVKVCDGHRRELEVFSSTVAAFDQQRMLPEIEGNIERACAIWNWR